MEIQITHTRCRWTSQRGVEFVPVDYKTYPGSQGYTDIRHFEIDLNKYDIDLPVQPNKTVPEIAKNVGAEVAINGPFASEGNPIGYIVKDGKLIHGTSVPQWIDFILSKDGKPRIAQLDPDNVSDIKLSFSSTSELGRDGKPYVNVKGEKTPADVNARDRPRTSIGIKADGKLVCVVVDGDASSDAGLTLPELWWVMHRLGAVSAMNLDGGGSSCLVQNGKEISGGSGERRLGAAITFKPKVQTKPVGNPFAVLPKYQDLRGKLPEHPTRRYVDLGIEVKTEIGIHHSLTDEGDAFSFANYHINTNGWPGVAYPFVIKKDGTIQHNWDISMRTYHVGDSNKISIGVCVVGDFRDSEPTAAQRESLRLLHKVLVEQMPNYERTRGHNEYPGYAWKACPEFDYKAVIFGDPEPVEKPKVLWRVQVGAFGVKGNAERLAAELMKAGYQTIIKEEEVK
jgi:hypothetical protein